MCSKMLLAVAIVVISIAVWLWMKSSTSKPPPKLDQNEWWGPNELKAKQDTSIRPFKVKFSEEMIKNLRFRLKNHRTIPPPLEGAGFRYGFNSEQLATWTSYWADEYNFSEREAFFNQFPQFQTNIQGLDIHFIRVKPEVPAGVTVIPLLLMHGWPGSVREFYETIPLLTKQRPGYDFAFEVIVPSLPGYGFSDAAVRPGCGPAQTGVIFHNLMNRLGFKKYYIQGGDWGSVVASMMVVMYPEAILGHHSNFMVAQNGPAFLRMFIGAYFPSLIVEPHLASRLYPLSNLFCYIMEEFGYFHLQATKPDSVGTALSDSPVGLLAYILEKFSTWTVLDNRNLPDGGLSTHFTKDQLIDNLMMYWATNSITTSMRMYAEAMSSNQRKIGFDKMTSTVPAWALQAKYELFYQPANVLKTKYPHLLGTTVLDDGGHFLAFEKPREMADDVFKAVNEFRKYHATNGRTEL
ncbi:juvenile hormone epoxide hydrolase-like isoform X2 [Aricia agestis]|uniref:juvenile hormone epoxide hydrolase-like isoform X2 n=1 Tax=Aricia agestis TaxID=91739 RepID=UPI001C2072F6|nr:juvenile hormone epoxide hydrolase-like isoform X2 [Aricia agestis]